MWWMRTSLPLDNAMSLSSDYSHVFNYSDAHVFENGLCTAVVLVHIIEGPDR